MLMTVDFDREIVWCLKRKIKADQTIELAKMKPPRQRGTVALPGMNSGLVRHPG